MGNKKLTDDQIKYKAFDKKRKIIAQILIYTLVFIIVFLLLGFKFADELPLLLLISISVFVLYTIATILICKKIFDLTYNAIF